MNPAIEAARRASQRATFATHQQLSEGINTLAAVGSVSLLFGIAATILIIAVFPFGPSNDRDARTFFMMTWLSHSLVPTALGVAVGVTAILCHRYLTSRLESLHHEMVCVSETLVTDLVRYGPFLKSNSESFETPMFGAEPLEQGERDECLRQFERDEQLRHSLIHVTRVALASALLFHSTSSFFVDLLNPVSAIVSSLFRVALHLAVCGSLVYPIWVWLLKRRPGVFVALSSALACCWAIVDFSLSWHHWLTDF